MELIVERMCCEYQCCDTVAAPGAEVHYRGQMGATSRNDCTVVLSTPTPPCVIAWRRARFCQLWLCANEVAGGQSKCLLNGRLLNSSSSCSCRPCAAATVTHPKGF